MPFEVDLDVPFYYEEGLEQFCFEPPEWHARAACRKVGNKIFFSEKKNEMRQAREICSKCPVTVECEQAGRFEHGFWGGLSEEERRRRWNRVRLPSQRPRSLV